MKTKNNWTRAFLAQALHSLQAHHLPRVIGCLGALSEQQIWWRPNDASNSVGNLALHLEGNVRQWIIAGLGGAPDRRQRDREFAARGPMARRVLARRLRGTVNEACRVLARLSARELAARHAIQRFRITGFEAVSHATEHFALHTGQIIYITKLQRGRDLGFTRLPGAPRRPSARKTLPAV
jgi:Protein of unknown function (DUF1572)